MKPAITPIPLLSLLPFLAVLLFAPAAAAQEDDDFFVFDEEEDDPGPLIADPLEPFNRSMFEFNDKLYRNFLKPVAVTYRHVPRPARVSIGNFFDNLGRPVSALNALLQLDLKNTGTELGRFAVNTTFGVAGLFDPASEMGLEQDNEDLGQTLGRYGIGHGPYLVVPFLGFSSLRDSIGSAGNTAMDPFLNDLETAELAGVTLLEAETELSLDPDTYESLYDNALDPYVFFRSSYVQNRDGQVDR